MSYNFIGSYLAQKRMSYNFCESYIDNYWMIVHLDVAQATITIVDYECNGYLNIPLSKYPNRTVFKTLLALWASWPSCSRGPEKYD